MTSSKGDISTDNGAHDLSRQFLTQLAEAIPQIVWTAKSDGRCDHLNQRWYEYTGLTEEESVDYEWTKIIHPDDLKNCLARWQHAYSTGEAYEVEYRLRRSDGIYRWHLGRACPVKDESHRILRWFGTCTDIEDQKQVQIMLQSVMDNITQSIFWKDRNSVYLGCNKLFAQQVGITNPSEIVGKTDYDLAPPKDQADFFRSCDRHVMDNDEAEFHIIEPQLQADGKQAWLDTSKIPLHDSDGKVIGILGWYEDVTDREKLIAQREDFMASLAHDLKVPIVGALRALEAILNGSLGSITSEQRDVISKLCSSHENLLQMIHMLLQVLRYEAEADELHFTRVDFARLVRECSAEVGPIAKSKDIQMDVSQPGQLRIIADPMALRRVVQNLLSNALAYAPESTTVHVTLKEAGNDWVVIEVTNHGEPIADEILEKLFQRFYQGAKIGVGAGLGLYLCHQIVERHGGQIRFTNNSAEGITISARLPKTANPEASSRPKRSKLSVSG